MSPDSSLKQENRLVLRDIKQRLTLCFRASIADLKAPQANQRDASCEDLALFFLGDKAGKPGKATVRRDEKVACQGKQDSRLFETSRARWRTDSRASKPDSGKHRSGRTSVTSRRRSVRFGKGIWNNVVPYSKHEGDYGATLQSGLERKHVPSFHVRGASFDPINKLALLQQHLSDRACVFTLHALVRRGRDHWTSSPRSGSGSRSQ